MKFITYSELNKDIIENLPKIPKNIDLVVGVPRSGLLVAIIIALYLNKPLADIDTYLKRSYFNIGYTKPRKNVIQTFDEISNVLVVEDTISSGKSVIATKNVIEKCPFSHNYIYLAAYTFSNSKDLVDIGFRNIDEDRVFEWNYLHSTLLEKACFDIDGVLCMDPTDEENDDGDKYRKFLKKTAIKLKPTRKIGHIVTSRLEKYRSETEEWLISNNIEFGFLHMMNLDSAEERRALGNHADFKAEIYKNLNDTTWFVESDPLQAQIIAQKTGKCVYCTGDQKCYDENSKYRIKTVLTQNMSHKLKGIIKGIAPTPIINMYRSIKRKT